MKSTSTPNIKWAERKDRLFVTIELSDVKDPKVELTDDNRIVFSGAVGDKEYSLDLELFGEVNKADSKWTLDTRNIFLNLKKKTKGAYWNYINKDKKKHNHIHVDWNMYVEEDDEDEAPAKGFPGMGGMGNDFDMSSLMGQMGGMGGMQGMDGMDGMQGMDGEDEDDQGKNPNQLDDLDKEAENK